MKTILPVVLHDSITNSLDFSYPLSILLTRDIWMPYIYENYMYILATENQRNSNRGNDFVYHDGYSYAHGHRDLLVQSGIPTAIGVHKTDLIQVLKLLLDQGNYIIIFVDEFYLPDCMLFNRSHFLHEQMLYGYDDQQQCFLALGMDKTSHYNYISHQYDNISTAYKEGLTCDTHRRPKWVNDNRIILLNTPDRLEEYPYSEMRYRSKLIRYLDGRLDADDIYRSDYINEGAKVHMGMQYYSYLLDLISQDNSGIFRYFQHLHEHKVMFHKALVYLSGRIDQQPFGQLVNEFDNNIVETSRILRSLSLKYQITGSSNEKAKVRMRSYINDLRDKEYEILNKIIGFLPES